MEIIWLERARNNLHGIIAYLEERNPDAARRTADRVYDAAHLLADMPRIGHKGQIPGTLEIVVAKTYCIIRYQIKSGRIEVLRVIDERTNWKKVQRRKMP